MKIKISIAFDAVFVYIINMKETAKLSTFSEKNKKNKKIFKNLLTIPK